MKACFGKWYAAPCFFHATELSRAETWILLALHRLVVSKVLKKPFRHNGQEDTFSPRSLCSTVRELTM